MILLTLPSGNLINPALIHGVIKFPGKGVALRNEYNKIICFEREPDNERQDLLVFEIEIVVNAGKDWTPPNWAATFKQLA